MHWRPNFAKRERLRNPLPRWQLGSRFSLAQFAYRQQHAVSTRAFCTNSGWAPQMGSWLSNSVSTASEWVMPDGGGYVVPTGYYIYRTTFPVPSVLPDGTVPTGVTINGRLASDNATYWIYLESPAPYPTGCAIASGQTFPVNPVGGNTFQQWWPFSFTNSLPLTPGAYAYLYIIVGNGIAIYNSSASGLRVEFFDTSAFN